MLQQTMSARKAQERIDCSAQRYGELIRDEKLSLSGAHAMLRDAGLNLFDIAGLAKAIACFQCSGE